VPPTEKTATNREREIQVAGPEREVQPGTSISQRLAPTQKGQEAADSSWNRGVCCPGDFGWRFIEYTVQGVKPAANSNPTDSENL
jgi:hypothetical protein